MNSCPSLPRLRELGFPTYCSSESDSHPANSSPYVLDGGSLRKCFSGDVLRLKFIDSLDRLLSRLHGSPQTFPAVLIGGGFIRRLNEGGEPKDLDALVFYQCTGELTPESLVSRLTRATPAARRLGLDLRFCPLDADPILLIKSVAFFSTLYSKNKNVLDVSNGLVLYKRV